MNKKDYVLGFVKQNFKMHSKCPWLLILTYTTWKVSKYGIFSGPYFPVFGVNAEIYFVNLRIQSEYRKIRTRKNSAFGHLSRSAIFHTPGNFHAYTSISISQLKTWAKSNQESTIYIQHLTKYKANQLYNKIKTIN